MASMHAWVAICQTQLKLNCNLEYEDWVTFGRTTSCPVSSWDVQLRFKDDGRQLTLQDVPSLTPRISLVRYMEDVDDQNWLFNICRETSTFYLWIFPSPKFKWIVYSPSQGSILSPIYSLSLNFPLTWVLNNVHKKIFSPAGHVLCAGVKVWKKTQDPGGLRDIFGIQRVPS